MSLQVAFAGSPRLAALAFIRQGGDLLQQDRRDFIARFIDHPRPQFRPSVRSWFRQLPQRRLQARYRQSLW
ncbi:hypothetical protein D3C76_1271400 [compost metagenome]